MLGSPISGIGTNKVIGLPMGMQAGLTKYCCFFCLWDSRTVSQHYKQKDWGSRSTFVPGEHSLEENPLANMNKVLLPPLHIKPKKEIIVASDTSNYGIGAVILHKFEDGTTKSMHPDKGGNSLYRRIRDRCKFLVQKMVYSRTSPIRYSAGE